MLVLAALLVVGVRARRAARKHKSAPAAEAARRSDDESSHQAVAAGGVERPPEPPEYQHMSALLNALSDPVNADASVRSLMELCRAEGPACGASAQAYLPGAPEGMPPHVAVRSAVVLRGGVQPLLLLVAPAVPPMPTSAIGPAMLTLCLLSLEPHLRLDLLSSGVLTTLNQVLAAGWLAEQQLAATIIDNLAQSTAEVGAFGEVVTPLVELAVRGLDESAEGDPSTIGQTAMAALNTLSANAQLKEAIDEAVRTTMA